MDWKKLGLWMMGVGIVFQPLNILTYGQWGIDIDIFGVLIFIIGLVIWLVNRRKKR